MLKAACVALALASLGACASIGHAQAAFSPNIESFDADAAPVESAVPIVRVTHALERRRFSPPADRQPDLRFIVATTADRGRRHIRRRVGGRTCRGRGAA
jgi:hypothetical protein